MEILSDDIVTAFNSMVGRSDFEVAFELVSGISDKIPPPSLINDVIFKVLMENCEESVANEANAYLCNYLMYLPLKRDGFRYDFRKALLDQSNVFEDIWSIFSHLVKSCFIHYNISKEKKISCNLQLIKYPNCYILLDFYVKVLTNFLSLENDLFEDDSETRFSTMLGWINKVYKVTDMRPVPVLDALHTILDSKINSDILYSTSNLETIVNLILNKCPGVFKNPEKIAGFFAKSNLPILHLRICEHKLYELIYQNKLTEKQTPLSLKSIIYNYFVCDSEQDGLEKKKQLCSSNGSNNLTRLFLMKNTKGGTRLHEYCSKNQYGDLFEMLLKDTSLNPNVKNGAGYTPLHIACLFNSYYCAKFLLKQDSITDNKVDVQATDNNGMTPLHCAAYVNNFDIINLLLECGGSQLVLVKDNFGKKAIEYTTSKLLKKFLEIKEYTIQASTENHLLSVPLMRNKSEYSIFLYCLQVMLSNYLYTYNLLQDKLNKVSHQDHKCHHYVSNTNTEICDEDYSVFERLPQLLDCFFTCVQNDANRIGVEVQVDLLPLRILRLRLDC